MKVLQSLPSGDGCECVDLVDDNGRFSLKLFRRDPEDQGRWTIMADFSARTVTDKGEALAEARRFIEALDS